MNIFIINLYKENFYTKEDMELFLKVGYISQEEYNTVVK